MVPSAGLKVLLNFWPVNLADFFLSFPAIQRKINCLPLNANRIIAHLENEINFFKNCRSSVMPSCCQGLESKRWQIENTQEKLDKTRVVSAKSWKDKKRCFLPIDETRNETWRAVNLCYKKERYLRHGTHCCKLEVLKNFLLIMGTYSEYLDTLITMVWFSSRYKILCSPIRRRPPECEFCTSTDWIERQKVCQAVSQESEMGQLSVFTCWVSFEC